MRVFGKKPSEIRKALAGFASALIVLLVALPVVGLPLSVATAVASITAFLTAVCIYLSKPNVAAVIDSLDTVEFELAWGDDEASDPELVKS